MPFYLTQKMSSGVLPAVTYYRKQTQDHEPAAEARGFTIAASTDYATSNGIPNSQVEEGVRRSNQGVPIGGTVKLI